MCGVCEMKKNIILLFKISVVCCVFLVAAIFIAFANSKNSVAVLNYHQINDVDNNALTVSVADFEDQMRYLKENDYKTITPEEMLAAFKNNTPLPEKAVIITFDDGYLDNYKNAYPILKKYGLKATIFVITDYVSLYPNYVTWDELKEMQGSGIINIESHTMDHLNLLKVDKNEARLQLSGSKHWLEAHLKKPIKFLAYPEGDYNNEIINILKDLGYEGAFTVSYAKASKDENPYELSRVPIFGYEKNTTQRFKLRLDFAPVFSPLEKLKKTLRYNNLGFIADFIYVP